MKEKNILNVRKFLIIILSYFSTSLIAQNTFLLNPDESNDIINQSTNSINNSNSSSLKKGITIWSEDFGSGFPAGWATEDLSGICPWVWSNDGSYGYFNSNQGGAGPSINSTTANNGFLICDNDSANNVNYGQPSGSNYQYLETYFITSAIDLSGHPSVLLEFQQYYRYNNSVDMNVMVSNDSINWTTYTVQNSSNNTTSANPDTVKINISAVAGNQSNVYLKIGWNARVYHWQIDDIKISETENNDLTITSFNFESQGLPYYQIPSSQVTGINFSAEVINNGANDQSNTMLSIDINSTNIGTSTPIYLMSGLSDSLYLNSGYTPNTQVGQLEIDFNIISDSTDENPSDNIMTETIYITDHIYARDMDVVDGGRDNDGLAYEYGNYFDIINTQSLTYVDFNISTNANVGAVVYGAVYQYDANSQSFVWQESTDDYILTSNNVNNGELLSLPLFSPLSLTAGEGYLVVAGAYGDGGATNDLRITTSGQSSPGNSLIYKNGSSGLAWYWTTATPMVRMNFNPSWGVSNYYNYDAILGQNTPNPFKDNTSINIELMSLSNIDFEITDITGKVVKHLELGLLSPGNHNININSDNLKSGIYYYSFISDKFKMTKKMIIIN
jgi:hypothetical protein